MIQPLNGLRVLDLSRLLPGAYASLILADSGADVVKIEEPGSGDPTRLVPPYTDDGTSLYFGALNRNKRSLTLNLRTSEGREVFLQLVRSADVVLESFRPGVMARLGLDYDRLKAVNPRLIYCAITGYGQDGPYRLRAGHDLNYAGYAGLLAYNCAADGTPMLPATQLGDLAGGSLMAVIGLLSALLARTQTGLGCLVDTSMTEGLLALFPLLSTLYLNTGQEPVPRTSPLDGGLPCYNIYPTSDGKYITLAALEYKFWQTFCTHVGHPELLPLHQPSEPAERAHAIALLRELFQTRTQAEWLHDLADIDACVGPVYSLSEALNDPQTQARGGSIQFSNPSFRSLPPFLHLSNSASLQRYPPPALGEHTTELLQALGYAENQLVSLRNAGII